MVERRSSIDRLPEELLAAIERAISRKATVDELVALVNGAGHQISRSAMGRHRKVSSERLAKFRETQEIAGDWVRQLRADPDGDIGRMLGEMLKLLAFRTQMDMQEDGTTLKPTDIAMLARALKDLGQTDRLKDAQEEQRQARANARAAQTAVAAAREAGLSEERVAMLRRRLLGLKPEKAKEAAA